MIHISYPLKWKRNKDYSIWKKRCRQREEAMLIDSKGEIPMEDDLNLRLISIERKLQKAIPSVLPLTDYNLL